MTKEYDEAVADYQWVKENIRYSLTPWRDPQYTLDTGRGHCGHKAELLSAFLRQRGIRTRYIEGRYPVNAIPAMASLSMHIWLEAEIDGHWVTLDPTPDSEIARSLGDTEPGTHLGQHALEVVHDEIPIEYKQAYNSPLAGLVRMYYNTRIYCARRLGG